MTIYHVKIRRYSLALVCFMLCVVTNSCSQKSTFVSPTIDGEYETGIDDTELFIVVRDGSLNGVYSDSISSSTAIKAKVKFFPYNSVGYSNASNFLSTITNYRCQTLTIATNTKDENIKYYVVMYGKKRNCWYKQ